MKNKNSTIKSDDISLSNGSIKKGKRTSSLQFSGLDVFENLLGLLVFVSAILILFVWLWFHQGVSDIQYHTKYILDHYSGKADALPNFMYFQVVYLLSGRSQDFNFLFFVSLVVISASVYFKYMASKFIAYNYLNNFNLSATNPAIKIIPLLLVVCLLLLQFVHNIFTIRTDHPDWFMLGYFPPNVWHNSTVMFLMPFALLLFWYSYKFLVEDNYKNIVSIAILILINAYAKPSFLFCFIVSFPVICFIQFKFTKNFFIGTVLSLLSLIIVLVMTKIIFSGDASGQTIGNPETGIEIAPFKVWKVYGESIIKTLVFSMFFPIVVTVVYFKNVFKNPFYLYSVILCLAGLVVSAMVCEVGKRAMHGNFQWQNVVCIFLLFLTSIVFTFENIFKRGKFHILDLVIAIAFLTHAVMGARYIHKILFTNMGYF